MCTAEPAVGGGEYAGRSDGAGLARDRYKHGITSDHSVADRNRRAACVALQPQMGLLPRRGSWTDPDRSRDSVFDRTSVTYVHCRVRPYASSRIAFVARCIVCTTTPPIASAILCISHTGCNGVCRNVIMRRLAANEISRRC